MDFYHVDATRRPALTQICRYAEREREVASTRICISWLPVKLRLTFGQILVGQMPGYKLEPREFVGISIKLEKDRLARWPSTTHLTRGVDSFVRRISLAWFSGAISAQSKINFVIIIGLENWMNLYYNNDCNAYISYPIHISLRLNVESLSAQFVETIKSAIILLELAFSPQAGRHLFSTQSWLPIPVNLGHLSVGTRSALPFSRSKHIYAIVRYISLCTRNPWSPCAVFRWYR